MSSLGFMDLVILNDGNGSKEVISGQLRTWSVIGVVLFVYYLCMLSAYIWCIISSWSVQTDFVLLVNYHLSYHCNM